MVAKRPSCGSRATNQCSNSHQCETREAFGAQYTSSHSSRETEHDTSLRVLQSSPASSRGLFVTEEHYVSDGVVAPIPSPTSSVQTWSTTPPEYSFAASSEGHHWAEAFFAEDATHSQWSSTSSSEEPFQVPLNFTSRQTSPVPPPPPPSPAQREKDFPCPVPLKPRSSDISTSSFLPDVVHWCSSTSTDTPVPANSQQEEIQESDSDAALSDIAPGVAISTSELQDEPLWSTLMALRWEVAFARCTKAPSVFFPSWIIFTVMTLVFAISLWAALHKAIYGK